MDTRRALQAAAITFGVAVVLGTLAADRVQARVAASTVPAGNRSPVVLAAGCRDRGDCSSPLKGGLRITFTGWTCTTGFVARATKTGKLYLVTAGHCTAGSGLFAQWSHHGASIGRAALDAFEDGSSADAGAIEIDEVGVSNLVYASSNADIGSVTASLADRSQTIGSEVCRSGGTSEWTCGHVVATDVDTKIAGKHIRHTWWTDFPSASGDSGGPVLDPAGHLLGIVIATTATQSVYSTVDRISAELAVLPCVTPTCA
jgi:streptogrisin D